MCLAELGVSVAGRRSQLAFDLDIEVDTRADLQLTSHNAVAHLPNTTERVGGGCLNDLLLLQLRNQFFPAILESYEPTNHDFYAGM